MRKLFYALVVEVVTASFCIGCGSDISGTAKTESPEQQTTEEATTTPEETLAPTPEPTEESVPQYTYTDMSATMYA